MPATFLTDLSLVVANIATQLGVIGGALMEPPYGIFVGLAIVGIGFGFVRGFIGSRN